MLEKDKFVNKARSQVNEFIEEIETRKSAEIK